MNTCDEAIDLSMNLTWTSFYTNQASNLVNMSHMIVMNVLEVDKYVITFDLYCLESQLQRKVIKGMM